MKNGKLILGIAAFVTSIGAAFAFKAYNFTGRQRLFGATNAGSLNCTL